MIDIPKIRHILEKKIKIMYDILELEENVRNR
jgi:hypothetical protein